MKQVTIVVVIALLIVGTAVAGLAYDRKGFLFLNEIESGMHGTGKTIVAGNVISEFTVEVLGVIDEPGEHSDFIVVRVSGEAIGRSGGIAQGMSGSPIYIGGKLIGALSRAAAWSKEITPIGLVTPIEQMLQIIDSLNGKPVSSRPSKEVILSGVTLVEAVAPPPPPPSKQRRYDLLLPGLFPAPRHRPLRAITRNADGRSHYTTRRSPRQVSAQ